MSTAKKPFIYTERDLGWITPCWIPNNAKSLHHTYGYVRSYADCYGPIPMDRNSGRRSLSVCHLCDIHACINPKHLFLDTQASNCRDAVNKNRKLWNRSLAENPLFMEIDKAFIPKQPRPINELIEYESQVREEAAERVSKVVSRIRKIHYVYM